MPAFWKTKRSSGGRRPPGVAIEPTLAAAAFGLVAERGDDGTILALGLAPGPDGAAGRLLELLWRPGVSLAAREVALDAPVGAGPACLSLRGDLLLLGYAPYGLALVDRRDGAVRRLGDLPGPGALTPDGRAVVIATDHGLLWLPFAPTPEPSAHPRFLRPMQVFPIDSPRSMALVPGPEPGRFALALGGYGCAALALAGPKAPACAAVAVLPLETPGLPYDPLVLQLPPPLRAGPGAHVFLTDEGLAGLGAIELASGRFEACPLEGRGYHAVGLCLPRLDGAQCLFVTRDAARWRWAPGAAPRPVPPLDGTPVLWEGEALLLLDAAAGRIREARLAE